LITCVEYLISKLIKTCTTKTVPQTWQNYSYNILTQINQMPCMSLVGLPSGTWIIYYLGNF